MDDGRKIAAPFWADADSTGIVYFTQTRSSMVRNKANAQINNATLPMGNGNSFAATDILIVTWENVGYHGSTDNKVHTYIMNFCFVAMAICISVVSV